MAAKKREAVSAKGTSGTSGTKEVLSTQQGSKKEQGPVVEPDSMLPPEPRPEEAYSLFETRTRELLPEQIKEFRADSELALSNVRTGLQSLAPFFPTFPAHLPRIEVEALLEVRTLASALVHADLQVGDRPLSPQEIEDKLARLRELRLVALESAELLAKRGLLQDARVKKIREGSGRHDTARDGVELEKLFRENEQAIRNKHPLSPEELQELGKLGHELVQVFPPPGGHKPLSKDEQAQATAMDQRNRLWTLLLQSHVQMRKAGYYFFGEEVDEHVPALQSRKRASVGAKKTEPADPVSPVTPPTS
jgi:hypothetical protein